MRIVTYHPRARVGDGGITNSVRRLSEAWARVGATPVIAFDGGGGPLVEEGVTWWPVRHVGRAATRVPVDLAPAFVDADVVILNSAWSSTNVAAGAAARRLGVPYVLAPRGAYDPRIVARRRRRKRAWWLALERRLVAGAAAIHVFFDEQRRDLEALGYRGPVIEAPNGVQVPTERRWDGGSGGYVLYLGRFDPEHKGLDLLLDAYASLPDGQRPALRLHGPDWRGGKAVVERHVRRLGLAPQVHVGDAVYGDDKWRTVTRAAGLVYPSRWEGFGNSLAEAAGLGVPTLATPYPLAGYLGARGACTVVGASVPELAAGLVALTGPGAAATGAAGERVVADELSWDAVARRWLDQLGGLRP